MKILITILLTSLVIFLFVLWLNYASYNGSKINSQNIDHEKRN